jgi:hypothetical protein
MGVLFLSFGVFCKLINLGFFVHIIKWVFVILWIYYLYFSFGDSEKGMQSESKPGTINMRCHHCAGPLTKDMVNFFTFYHNPFPNLFFFFPAL